PLPAPKASRHATRRRTTTMPNESLRSAPDCPAATTAATQSTPSRSSEMAKDALVSEELASKFVTEKETPYTRWVCEQGLDIIGAHYVPNLNTIPLNAWIQHFNGSGREPAWFVAVTNGSPVINLYVYL